MGPKKKKKSSGKKKVIKAEQLRLQKEEEERRLKEEEEAQFQAQQEEASRLEKERIEQEQMEKLEAKDQERRESELAELHSLEQKFLSAQQWKTDYRAYGKWEHYLSCDGSPDPAVLQEINTFMSLWRDDQNEDVQLVMEKGEQVLNLIEKLQLLLLDTPPSEITEKETVQYQESILELQNLLHQKYNGATEHLLKTAVSFKENSNSIADINETEEEIEKKSEILDLPSQVQHPLTQEGMDEKEEAITDENIVDLQQFVPVGGVYHIDALQLPPQVKQIKDWSMVEVLDVGLQAYPYPPEEAEDATHPPIQITLRLSDNVMYFEDPVIARWDPAGQQWRTDGISNITYERQAKSITFEMRAFYTIALLQDAHLNMPYQAWELRPTGMDEALLIVTTVFATIQIQIKGNQCMLSSVVVEEKDVLSYVTGKWLSPVDLRAVLKKAGVNIFPGAYSHKYVSVNKKAPLAEVRAYQQMALVASAFAFAWSKWNLEAGQEQVVFKESGATAGVAKPCILQRQTRWKILVLIQYLVSEHLKADSVKDWSLYMFNGQKAQKLKITETSEAFSEELEEDSEFHSTLYHMLKDFASKEAIDKVETANFLFIDVVYQLLLATRVLTYS
ncbi:dynein intermediate chain CFAP94, axonemal isoform X10 [Aquila chrysaetos chrysaetos]|uniref:dynein intermediate chain CFAP94, axonemal isoform X10 n=1 Tax=Aquila chrysaetos chrysaetos TaxID=223781 RepID=UPI001B7D4611|nr:dynein intermediate chain CFAP94, axonemal isoform X10 [Aquila chrysaetos chrysaetos]